MYENKFITLAKLLRNEYQSASYLSELQNRKLRHLIHYACSNVPFYREKFREAGVKPDDIRTPSDLHLLPIIRKSELVEEDPLRIRNPSIAEHHLVERLTSGSSGAPFRFHVDRAYDRFCKAQFVRPYFSNGRRVFDKAFTISARPAPARKWFQRLGMLDNVVIPSHFDGEELLENYLKLRPDLVTGYPSTLSTLAGAAIAGHNSIHRPKIVFTDSELLTSFTREQLKLAFKAPVIDIYGTIETENIAWQCGPDSQYHYASDCVILETVKDGVHTEADEPGSLVCTVLNSLTMPFIRYEIGDLVTLSSRPCDCGRTLPLIGSIDGRQMDQLVLPDGRRVSSMAVTLSKALAGTVREYQVVQESVAEFTFLLVLSKPLSDSQRAEIERITTTISPGARVTIQKVDSIPREPSGKRRMFVSRVR